MTIDYTKINQLTVQDTYALQRISDILPQLSKAKKFTKLDLSSGFYQIKMDPASRKFTAFLCE